MKKHEKQIWVNVEKQLKKRINPDDIYEEDDLKIAKAFFKAGFNVYPESGFMFQKITPYEDGSYNEACLDIEEVRIIYRHLLNSPTASANAESLIGIKRKPCEVSQIPDGTSLNSDSEVTPKFKFLLPSDSKWKSILCA